MKETYHTHTQADGLAHQVLVMSCGGVTASSSSIFNVDSLPLPVQRPGFCFPFGLDDFIETKTASILSTFNSGGL